MFNVLLLTALCAADGAAAHGKKNYPPPVIDGHGHPGYHNHGGWGRPYGGYAWPGYACWGPPGLHVTVPADPLVVPPPGAYRIKDEDADEVDGRPADADDKSSNGLSDSDKDEKGKAGKNGKNGKDRDDKDGGDPPTTGMAKAGLGVSDLGPELAEALGFPRSTQGVLVTRVARQGLARDAGLRPGMVIFRVDSKPVSTARSAERAISGGSAQQGIEVEVRTLDGGTRKMILREEELSFPR